MKGSARFYDVIGAPVIVNLVSAIILFLLALVLKDPIRRLFFGEDTSFPLYCSAELIPSAERPGKADVELLIINLSRGELSRSDLQKLINQEDDVPAPRSADIMVRPKNGATLLGFEWDEKFNVKKGTPSVITNVTGSGSDKAFRIVVNQIEPSAILRAFIRTDLDIGAFGRNDKRKVPITIQYPGRKQSGQDDYSWF